MLPDRFVNMKKRLHAGLGSLAMLLIFVPEPVTTLAGIGLLGYVRHAMKVGQTIWRKTGNFFEEYYTASIGTMKDGIIKFQVSTTRQGQLPLARSNISRLYHMPHLWPSYKLTTRQEPKPKQLTTSTKHPAGFLKSSRTKVHDKLYIPEHTQK